MAKQEPDKNQIDNATVASEETDVQQASVEKKGKKGKKNKNTVKSEEELYIETLSKTERKAYERQKRSLRRSQWVDEYWIIIILAVAVLLVICCLVVINYVRAFSKGDLVSTFSGIFAFLRGKLL